MEQSYLQRISKIAEAFEHHVANVPTTTITVEVAIGGTISAFSKALVKEVERKNLIIAQQVALTEEELTRYAQFMLTQRIKIVNDDCRDFRFVKNLTMPCFLEMALTKIGKVEIREQALTLVPIDVNPSLMTIKEATEVSDKLRAVETLVNVVHGGMPKTISGDPEVMTLMICQDQVLSMTKSCDPIVPYLANFFNMKLQDELFGVLYRVRYEDVTTLNQLFAEIAKQVV